MKKVLLVLMLLIAFVSCSPEDLGADCSCGFIVSDRVEDYSVVIRNDCTGNEKIWYLAQGDWMNAHPGMDYCITNAQEW